MGYFVQQCRDREQKVRQGRKDADKPRKDFE